MTLQTTFVKCSYRRIFHTKAVYLFVSIIADQPPSTTFNALTKQAIKIKKVNKSKNKFFLKSLDFGGSPGSSFPDFSGLGDLTNQLSNFFNNSPVFDVDQTTGVPTFNQENFGTEIGKNVSQHFEQNPIPKLDIGNFQSFGNAFQNLLQLQQKSTTGDPFHKNLVNSLTVQPNQGFNLGGFIQSLPIFENGGQVPQLVPVQTEKGEYIAFEDGTLTPVRAKASHKAQDKGNVTDLLPDNNTYVFSATDRMKLSQVDAENISFGYTPLDYREGDNQQQQPEEILLSDLFKKDKELPANLVKTIQKRYPLTDRENDYFSTFANDENLDSRKPWIEGVKLMSELKKPQKETPQLFELGGGIFAPLKPVTGFYPKSNFQQDNGLSPLNTTPKYLEPSYLKNNSYANGGAIPKMPAGGEIAAAALDFIPKIVSLFQQGKQNKATRNAMNAQIEQADRIQNFAEDQYQNILDTRDRLLPLADNLYQTQTGNLQNASALSLAGIMGQNPYFDAPDLSATRSILSAQADRVPNAVRNQAYSAAATPFRSVARNIGRISPNQRSAVLSNAGANELNSRSQLAANFAGQDINLGNRYLQQLGALEQQNANNLANQQNKIRGNENNQLGSAANVGTNFFNQSNQLAQGNLANQMAIESAVAPAMAANLNSMTNAANAQATANGLIFPLAQGQQQFTNNLFDIGKGVFDFGQSAGWFGNNGNGGQSFVNPMAANVGANPFSTSVNYQLPTLNGG